MFISRKALFWSAFASVVLTLAAYTAQSVQRRERHYDTEIARLHKEVDALKEPQIIFADTIYASRFVVEDKKAKNAYAWLDSTGLEMNDESGNHTTVSGGLVYVTAPNGATAGLRP